MRKIIELDTLETLIGNGWNVANFDIQDKSESIGKPVRVLTVDLCCNWRLADGKVSFYQIDLRRGNENSDLARMMPLVAKAQAASVAALDRKLADLREELTTA